jgi:hypothetical protein
MFEPISNLNGSEIIKKKIETIKRKKKQPARRRTRAGT